MNTVTLSFLAIVLTVTTVIAVPKPDDKYTTKYDNVDIDQILKNDRLLNNYVKCLLEKGNCTPDAAELKKLLPDALKTECSKCSDTQKDRSEKVIRFLAKNKKSIWNELTAKYDPTGEYKNHWSKYAEEKNIDI